MTEQFSHNAPRYILSFRDASVARKRILYARGQRDESYILCFCIDCFFDSLVITLITTRNRTIYILIITALQMVALRKK